MAFLLDKDSIHIHKTKNINIYITKNHICMLYLCNKNFLDIPHLL